MHSKYWYVQQNEAKANDANKVQSVRTFNVIINATDSGGEAQKMSLKMSTYDYSQIFAGLTSTAKSRTQNSIYILNLTAKTQFELIKLCLDLICPGSTLAKTSADS